MKKQSNKPFQCVEYAHEQPFASTYLFFYKNLSKFLQATKFTIRIKRSILSEKYKKNYLKPIQQQTLLTNKTSFGTTAFFCPFFRTQNPMQWSAAVDGCFLAICTFTSFVWQQRKNLVATFSVWFIFPKEMFSIPPGCIASSPTKTENQEVHPLMHPIT